MSQLRFVRSLRLSSVRSVGRSPRVVEVQPLGGDALRLVFSDGLVRELDFTDVVSRRIFEKLGAPAVFARVAIDETAGTVAWPVGIDLDPDILHGDHEPASGKNARLVRECWLNQTA
jgi:hypothetical protein